MPPQKTTKRKPLGQRVSVEFGTAGKTTARASSAASGGSKKFVRMLESTQKLFGFKAAQDSALVRKTKDGRSVTVRGSKSVSIKVPTGKKNKTKAGKQYDQLKSVPVPSGASLTQIKQFLKKASKKPKYFVSPDGRQHSITTGK